MHRDSEVQEGKIADALRDLINEPSFAITSFVDTRKKFKVADVIRAVEYTSAYTDTYSWGESSPKRNYVLWAFSQDTKVDLVISPASKSDAMQLFSQPAKEGAAEGNSTGRE